MKKVTEFTKRVKGQVNNPVLAKDSWVVGIDIGKKKISCALMKKDQTVSIDRGRKQRHSCIHIIEKYYIIIID